MPGKPGPKPKSKVVKLSLPSDKLSQWPSNSTPRSAPSATPIKDSPAPGTPAADVKKEGTPSVPAPGGLEVPQRKKPGPPKGTKRKAAEALLPDGTPKPRGKPGPKKRKLDGDESTRPWTTPAGPAAHKLGPKANQGAINAGLRALDRSGKPCRKWGKRVFTVKSFTGQVWSLPSWGAPKKAVVKLDDENGEGKENATGSNSDNGNTPGANGIRSLQPASSDAGASGLPGTPKEGSAAPPASSPAPIGTPFEATA